MCALFRLLFLLSSPSLGHHGCHSLGTSQQDSAQGVCLPSHSVTMTANIFFRSVNLPLSDLTTKFSIPVIFYDQIGNSHLTHLPSKPGLLISSSPNSSTFSSTSTSRKDMGMWNMSTGELSKGFLDDVQKGLAVGVVDMEAYNKALRISRCLVDPWPEELASECLMLAMSM
ncbi:hypothetical protein EDD85DRAFT_996391 [Armillaria nabsnona]|nr:hypothetical protein EDD85DRAFT_996391 [Armillaria nabsnona]